MIKKKTVPGVVKTFGVQFLKKDQKINYHDGNDFLLSLILKQKKISNVQHFCIYFPLKYTGSPSSRQFSRFPPIDIFSI